MEQILRSQPRADQAMFAPVVAIVLCVVGAVSLLAYLAASAYAPDLRSLGDTRANALSRSAVGFAGLVRFLEELDVPVLISRGLDADAVVNASLLIVTPSVVNDSDAIDELIGEIYAPTLVILPKWIAAPAFGEPGRVTRSGSYEIEELTERFIEPYAETSTLLREPNETVLRAKAENLAAALPSVPSAIESLQTIRGDDWVPILADLAGHSVVGNLRDSDFYFLADPDLMNTHGLADLDNARIAAAIIAELRAGDGPVVFDVTLHGYTRSPNFLRVIFDPPILGATLCLVITALLMGVHAANRFGAAKGSVRAFAFGKRALADNSAALIAMLHREHHMAVRYAQVMRNAALRALGASHELTEDERNALLRAVRKQSGKGDSLDDLTARARNVTDRRGVLAIARRLHRWRHGLEHGSRQS